MFQAGEFAGPREHSSPRSTETVGVKVVPIEVRQRPPAVIPQLEDLYPVAEIRPYELNMAMRLLPEAVELTDQAIEVLKNERPLESDNAMMHVRALLPELFCCRSLGDGFGAVVNALLSAFENQEGLPLSHLQLEQVRRALLEIRENPWLAFGRALDLITGLEESGLRVDPPALDAIGELFDQYSVPGHQCPRRSAPEEDRRANQGQGGPPPV